MWKSENVRGRELLLRANVFFVCAAVSCNIPKTRVRGTDADVRITYACDMHVP